MTLTDKLLQWVSTKTVKYPQLHLVDMLRQRKVVVVRSNGEYDIINK